MGGMWQTMSNQLQSAFKTVFSGTVKESQKILNYTQASYQYLMGPLQTALNGFNSSVDYMDSMGDQLISVVEQYTEFVADWLKNGAEDVIDEIGDFFSSLSIKETQPSALFEPTHTILEGKTGLDSSNTNRLEPYYSPDIEQLSEQSSWVV